MRETLAASAALAAFAAVAAALLGQPAVGVGFATGLVIGALNGHMVAVTLVREVPFVAGAVMRLALLSAIAIVIALVLAAPIWAVLIGAGAAQLVMAVTAARQGVQA